MEESELSAAGAVPSGSGAEDLHPRPRPPGRALTTSANSSAVVAFVFFAAAAVLVFAGSYFWVLSALMGALFASVAIPLGVWVRVSSRRSSRADPSLGPNRSGSVGFAKLIVLVVLLLVALATAGSFVVLVVMVAASGV